MRHLDAAQCFNGSGCRNRRVVNEPGFHEFPARNRRFAGDQSPNRYTEITFPRDGCVRLIAEILRIPWMRENNGHLIRTREGRYCVRSKEIEVDKRTEEVLTPAVSVQKQDIPTVFGHQVHKLPTSFNIQHGRSVYKEVLQSRHP